MIAGGSQIVSCSSCGNPGHVASLCSSMPFQASTSRAPHPPRVQLPTGKLGRQQLQTLQPGPLPPSQMEPLPPITFIIGDSITRDICFINAITCCFPGAIVPVILNTHLNLLPSCLKIVLHVGSNDTSRPKTT